MILATLLQSFGPGLVEVLIYALGGGSVTAVGVFTKLVQNKKIQKGMTNALTEFVSDNGKPNTKEVLDEELKKHVPNANINSLDDLQKR